MSNTVRKLSKNEILKAMDCYDRYPYMPFWWIVKEISENGYGIDRLNYEFKYGYDNPEKGHFHQSYSPSKEQKDIYRYMENYIVNRRCNTPHNTSLCMQDYFNACCSYGENSFLNFASYVNRGNFEQALKEREYWRGARGFIDKYIPKEVENGTWQDSNINYARRFGRKAYKYVGDIIARNGMSSSDPRAIAMHGTIGGMIAKMCGKNYIQGEVLGEINKEIVAQIYKNKKTIGFTDRDVINFSRQLGEHLGTSLGLGSNLGGEIAEMATRWNTLGNHTDLSFNVDLFQRLRNNGVKRFIVANYGISADRPGGHTAIIVVLDDGMDTMLEIGSGPEYSSGKTDIALSNAKREFYIKKINLKDLEDRKESLSLHTFDDFNGEHKNRFVNSVQSVLDGKTVFGELEKKEYVDAQRYVSKGAFYRPADRNCVNSTVDMLKETTGEDYSEPGFNEPYFVGKKLVNKRGWSSRYINMAPYFSDNKNGIGQQLDKALEDNANSGIVES